jgi:putative ABC transport system substrate-binding protein
LFLYIPKVGYNFIITNRGNILKKSVLPLMFILVFFIVFLFLNDTSEEKERLFRIGVLNYTQAAGPALMGLKNGLAKKGLFTNVNVEYIYKGPIRDKAMLRQEAERLSKIKPDILYTMSTTATLAAKEPAARYNIPIVFGPVSAPVQSGIVSSMRERDENITGVSFGPQEGRRLEMLAKIIPSAKRVLIPYNANDKSPVIGIENLKPIAENLGLELEFLPLRIPENTAVELENYKGSFDAIFTPTDSSMVAVSDDIAAFAILRKVPYSCPQKEGVLGGALFSYGFSIEELGEQASRLVYMIYNGTPANEIPVELSDFKLSINMNTAKLIGLKIPEYLSSSAVIIGENNVY